jgi:hypothetical protein
VNTEITSTEIVAAQELLLAQKPHMKPQDYLALRDMINRVMDAWLAEYFGRVK